MINSGRDLYEQQFPLWYEFGLERPTPWTELTDEQRESWEQLVTEIGEQDRER